MSTPSPAPPTPPDPDVPPLPDPDVRDSNPNAGSRHGLGGGMGVSSERVPDDPDSIEGTGSRGTATEKPDGIWNTVDGKVSREWRESQGGPGTLPVEPD